jgi:lipid A 4'-phosphatase
MEARSRIENLVIDWRKCGIAAVLALLILNLFPSIDLAVSVWFYRPGQGFPLAHLAFFGFVMKALPDLAIGAAGTAAILGTASLIAGRVWLTLTPRRSLYLVATLALGPGVIVNSLLKDHWGRARPHQIVEFGGNAHFTPAALLADQCTRNCSFPSGHAALAFWLIAFAFLLPTGKRFPAVVAALLVGALVGLMRIAQGAHFLSDVLAAAILVVGINIGLKRMILGRDMRTK